MEIFYPINEFIQFFKQIPKAREESIEAIYSILIESTAIKRELSPLDWKQYISSRFAA